MRGDRAHTLDVHKSCVDSIGRAPHEVGVLCWHVAHLMPISLYSLQEADGGWDTSSMDDEAHPVGVRSVSWAPSTAPGALVCSALLHPLHNLCSGGCDNTVKLWKLHHGTSIHTFSVYFA